MKRNLLFSFFDVILIPKETYLNVTVAGVVPCGGRKSHSLYHHSADY